MSVQSEINRLANAKTALATAIEGKGVTVPEGTKLDGMAALVESIEAGGGDIVVGSFTLTEGLTTSSPLYIDITFPKNEFPLMYCVFEDARNLKYTDTSHTATRIINVTGISVYDSDKRYIAMSTYMKSGSYSHNHISDIITHISNGYADAGGIYGSMDISLNDNQVMFKPTVNGGCYLAGRTYYYILYWG